MSMTRRALSSRSRIVLSLALAIVTVSAGHAAANRDRQRIDLRGVKMLMHDRALGPIGAGLGSLKSPG